MPRSRLLSENVEEYLEAIHRLSGSPEGVSTMSLARHCGVTPASVTGMLRRLHEIGLIKYRRYHDIVLTERGEQLSHELIRRHRLAERLLTDILKVPIEEAHEEACRLEHVFSPQLERRIVEALGEPDACPHGHPIDLSAMDDTVPLTDAPVGPELLIARLDNEAAQTVRYLADRDLLPGTRVTIERKEPTAGTITLTTRAATYVLGMAMAATIRVYLPGRGIPT